MDFIVLHSLFWNTINQQMSEVMQTAKCPSSFELYISRPGMPLANQIRGPTKYCIIQDLDPQKYALNNFFVSEDQIQFPR